MKNTHHYTILALLLTMTLWGKAQTRLFFSMGVIDRPTNEAKVAGYVTTINKNTACLQLVSGLYAYYGIAGNKLFAIDCPTGPVIVRPDIKLFPNPIKNYTRVQSNMLLTEHPLLKLVIIDASGRTVLRSAINNTQLHAGHSLFLGMLSAGSYFLKIESASLKQVIPFIKVN